MIDSNLLCWAAAHTMGDLVDGENNTGVIFGFLSRLYFLVRYFNTGNVVFCWDSNFSFRRQEFAGYKKGRHEKERTEEELAMYKATYRQVNLLSDFILPQMGFRNVISQTGIESDDLIAMACSNDVVGQAVIVTCDQDMFQLLSPRVIVYNPSTRRLINEERFEAEFKIQPSLWNRVKAIAGCDSDEVPGIRGVGVKTACKYLKGELKETSVAFNAITSIEGQFIIDRNLPLVTIPHPKTKPFVIHPQNDFSPTQFREICERYGMVSLADKAEE